MTKIRKSDANFTGTAQYAASRLHGNLWRTAARMCAEDAQKKIDERHAQKVATPLSCACKANGHSHYPDEFVAEMLQIVAAGWSVASTARMAGIPKHTLYNWVNGTVRAPSATSIKTRRKR